jgi:hypothetical protein
MWCEDHLDHLLAHAVLFWVSHDELHLDDIMVNAFDCEHQVAEQYTRPKVLKATIAS